MISMFLTINNRTSSAVEDLQVDALNKQAIVTFTNGNTYAYGNVSTRAIVNLIFNPDVSLGFWVNNNLVKSERAYVLNGDEFNYSKVSSKRARLEAILDTKEPQLPSFV
tara:strand:- start:628 stop:954 length:327 start_codon:yes stop_codon:yes gene_type:complete